MKKDCKVLFEEIMDSLFSDREKEKTLEDYKKMNYEGFPKEKGIYVVKNSQNIKIEILQKPEIQLVENPKTKKSQNEYDEDFLKKCEQVNKKYLYIGKTDAKISKRLSDYIKYGYGADVKHYGGYYLWFVKNNKHLYLNYATLSEIEKKQKELYDKAEILSQKYYTEYKKHMSEMIEVGLICLHDLAYGFAPLANAQEQPEYLSYKKENDTKAYKKYIEWKKYWESFINK